MGRDWDPVAKKKWDGMGLNLKIVNGMEWDGTAVGWDGMGWDLKIANGMGWEKIKDFEK